MSGLGQTEAQAAALPWAGGFYRDRTRAWPAPLDLAGRAVTLSQAEHLVDLDQVDQAYLATLDNPAQFNPQRGPLIFGIFLLMVGAAGIVVAGLLRNKGWKVIVGAAVPSGVALLTGVLVVVGNRCGMVQNRDLLWHAIFAQQAALIYRQHTGASGSAAVVAASSTQSIEPQRPVFPPSAIARPSVAAATPRRTPAPTLDPAKIELLARYLHIHARRVASNLKELSYLSGKDSLLNALRSTDADWVAEDAAIYIATLFRPRTEATEVEFSAHLTAIDSSREDLIHAIYHRSDTPAMTSALLRAAPESSNTPDVHLSDADYKTFLAMIVVPPPHVSPIAESPSPLPAHAVAARVITTAAPVSQLNPGHSKPPNRHMPSAPTRDFAQLVSHCGTGDLDRANLLNRAKNEALNPRECFTALFGLLRDATFKGLGKEEKSVLLSGLIKSLKKTADAKEIGMVLGRQDKALRSEIVSLCRPWTVLGMAEGIIDAAVTFKKADPAAGEELVTLLFAQFEGGVYLLSSFLNAQGKTLRDNQFVDAARNGLFSTQEGAHRSIQDIFANKMANI